MTRRRIELDEQAIDAVVGFCRAAHLPVPSRERRFHPVRRWRVDYLWEEPYYIALEVEGGYAVGGRHTSVAGFLGDLQKYNALAEAGYRLIRCTPRMVESGEAFDLIARILKGGHP